MKVRISFYFVCVIFGLASCGVVPSNFKSPHDDEHIHAEEIVPSTVPNASIPILLNSTESQNTSSKVIGDHHQLNISDVLISDFHNVSVFNHVQRDVLEEDLAFKKLTKGSGRSKKKSQKDTSRFIKPSHAKIDHAGMKDTHHHGSADDQSSESHHRQTDHETEDLKTQGSLDDHSLESHLKTHHETEIFKFNSSVDGDSLEHHHLDTDHKTDDLNIQGSADDHSIDSHLKPHHKTEIFKFNSTVDGNSSEHHHLETDHKTDDLEIQGSVDDHSSVPHHLETNHIAKVFKFNKSVDNNSSEHHHLDTDHNIDNLNVQGSVDNHSSEPHHLETNHIAKDLKINVSLDDDSLEPHHQQTDDHKTEDMEISVSVDDHFLERHHLELDRKTDNLGFHGTAEDHFSELDHASENFSHTDKNVSESVNIENASAHFGEKPGHSKDFANTFNGMLQIPIHELNRKEKDFVDEEFGNENHTEDAKHEMNNLNENISQISHSDDLINSTKDLSHNWNNASQEINKDSNNNNLSEFSNSIKSVVHGSNNLNQDNLNDSVTTHSIDFINSVLDFTNDSSHTNKEYVNDSVVIQSNDLTKSVNEVHNISEDLKNMKLNTSEFKNDSHNPPKTTESTQEHFNHADNTGNLLKSTVASITNSKLFLNIHNSFMRLNPTEKPDSANLKHVDETSENVRSVSDDLNTSKISERNSNKPSNIDANSRDVSSLDIKEDITSPSNTVADISVAETEVEFSTENKDKILEDPIINNKSESFDRVKEVGTAVENNASKGLFSSLGLDFLMNSELAKNAASAMKVFNFTDSALTDHIIDDQNDMHDLLNTRSSTGDDHNLSNSENSEQFNAIDDASDSSTFNALVTGSSKIDTESSTLVTERSSVVDNSDEVSEVNNNIKETFVKENNSLSVLSGTNGSIEAITPTTLIATEELANITISPTMFLNSTTEFNAKTETAQPDARNTSDVVVEVKCPPPGICIFWFFAQDTCTINSHCLGSRICCRIGCSKTCIEV